MNKLFDALEVCLHEIENGTDLETALARYPDLAGELRPILKTAIKARNMSAAEPSAEAARRGRARVMQRAAEIRESRRAPNRRVIPVFSRLAISFALVIAFLLSGTGILSASASALPGESLYPVKRGWESVRLFFIFDQEARELLANEFENERLHEIDELLAEGRHETIQFAGVFMRVKNNTYVSGLMVVLPENIQSPENGAPVIVSGRTNAQGFIEVTSLDLLPAGSVVPAGKPIEMELEEEGRPQPAPSPNPDDAADVPARYEIKGTLQAISANTLVINGMTVYLSNLSTQGLCIGMTVEATGYYGEDGRFIATGIEAEGECSDETGGGTSTPAVNENDDSESNENDDGSEDNGSDDNSTNDNEDDGNSNDDDNSDDSSNDNDDNEGNEDNDND
ncbi:MAG: hypothetical protein DPW18_16840 [Chloroflexi bacterium]|nr:hypothetical protein [Chloroflexota bacterium]MDL1911417.1 hypothetical protein [Chloroflexi bacterium CFX6]